jgi:sugar lactone lactonase YvrE
MQSILVDCVVREEAIVGESPVWCPREQVLYWVDITGQKIHRFHPSTGTNETLPLPEPVTALAVRTQGGLMLSLKKRFALFDLESRRLHYLDDPELDKPDNRFNDAKCDRAGRFWAGTMGNVHWDAPSGALYRFDPDGTITCHQRDVICANGMGWSPDNRTMYFTESFRYAVYAYDFDAAAGTISNRRVFAELDRASGGFPDGLTVDAEGHVWSVHNAVGRVVRVLVGAFLAAKSSIRCTSRRPAKRSRRSRSRPILCRAVCLPRCRAYAACLNLNSPDSNPSRPAGCRGNCYWARCSLWPRSFAWP